MKLNLKNPIVFFDLETTGTSINVDRIVEICYLKVHPNGNEEAKTLRINPEMHIPEGASAVHGIYDEDVADCPTFKEVARTIANDIEGCDLAGFNSNRFDIPVLAEEFLRAGVDIDLSRRKFVDVQVIFHKLEQRTLSAAYKFYCGKNLEDAHTAAADTQATYEVLMAQLDRYSELQNDIAFLADYSSFNKNVDFAGRMIYDDNGVEVFNFGKYKGMSVTDVLKRDPGYYSWILNSDFTLNTKATDKSAVNIEDAYAHVFNSKDLSDMTEVVFWKKYSIADGVIHNLSSNLGAGYVDNSGPAGLSQSLVDNYLNAAGTPIDPADGIFKDFTLTFKGRDGRLLATVKHSNCMFKSTSPETKSKAMLVEEYSEENKSVVRPPYLTEGGPARNATGYHIRMSIDTTYVSGQGETSLPMIRYAEALLAYAEAAEELGKCTPAVLEKTLKPIRERAGVTYADPSEIDPNFTDFGYAISANLQEIRRERRAELALQGFRLDDLMRWRAHKLIQGKRGTGAYFGTDGVLYKAFDPKSAADLKTILTTDGWLDPQKELLPRGYQFDSNRDYLLPVPPSEISLNHELKQNPGWQRK